jgi:Periplasmic copper-binding protein (NosD)
MRVRQRALIAVATAATLAFPATALAGGYPPASDPGKGPKNPPKGGTLKVCKKGCKYKKIQKAIDAAGKGTTVRVGKGTYKEGVKILSSTKDRVKLIGDPKNPGNVILEGKGLKGGPAQNGVQINNADGVQVNGFHARNYKGNGFFVVNADGYKLTNLVAELTGVYGLYAFNSKGGEMSNSEAFYNNDAGFYVGQTPPQTKPKRTTLKNVVAWGNVLGYSGTNSRYVTITKSKFFNNGLGIVPNVLDSEKFPPAEDNAIVDNDVFWNNFNFHKAAPFKQPSATADGVPYPLGTGILLFGGRNTVVENNRVWGNYLIGFGEINQIVLEIGNDADLKEAAILRNNVVRRNDFGLGGEDLNGRDMFYGGDGSGNCFEGNTLRSPTLPADGSTFVACGQPNTLNDDARNQGIAFSLDSTHEANWIRNPHKAIEGITPLEHWTAAYPHPEVK